MSKVIVLTCNKSHFQRFLYTYNLLVTKGNYKGDVCLVIGDDLNNDSLLENPIIKNTNIIVKYFPNITFTENFLQVNNNVKSDGRNITKKFQWHKLHLFNKFFKQWDYVFYLDSGITINSEINPMFDELPINSLFAHSDTYPKYDLKLSCQFDLTVPIYSEKLKNTYNLAIDYFQTTIMLYDTKIIEENTFNDLLKLMEEFPISRTNEQGIMALYFTNIRPLYRQIQIRNEETCFYDYFPRYSSENYIMLKQLHP